MRRFFLHSVQGRVLTILLLFMTVLLLVTWFIVRDFSQEVMSSEKSNKLLLAASLLDFELGDRTYDSILAEHDAQNASRDEQIKVLNVELSPLGEAVTELYPDIGIGYYSLDLDAILTYAPAELYADTVGKPIGEDHPGRLVMANNEAMVRTGSMVRGDIMNAMHPIARGGEVIGYAWANELTTSIETEYQAIVNNILIAMLVIYAISIAAAIILTRRSMRDIDNIVKGVRTLRSDLTYVIPKAGGDLGEVVDSINAMSTDILKAEEEHRALMLAEASNVAQRDFLARMSHEIRTPMNGVLGMTQLAQNAKTEEQRLEYLGKIHASATLLLGIINDILDVSKIEAGKMEMEMHPFKLADIIENIRDLMTPRVNEKGLDFVIEVDDSVPVMAVGDSLRISQILFNIIGNAVKFTLEGSITLKVFAQELADEKIRIDFSVQDTGIGMDREQQEAVFSSFAQADSSTARKFGGSGLGLSISKALAELMGGEINVKSELGHGSTFEFYIIAAACDETELQESADSTAADEIQKFDNYKILVVEDNEINQEIAQALLEDMGLVIDLANNGQEGVAAFLANTYDLIFMDIRMPVMDGLEATEEIRKIEHASAQAGAKPSRIPIFAMTANVMQADRDATLAAGMDGHVSKPIDIEEIRTVLNDVFKS